MSRHDNDDPERRCIVSGETAPKGGLIRFVVGPEDTVVPDVAGKLPGRGFWIGAQRDLVEKAMRKGLFARAAKASVRVSDTLVDDLERLLARRAIDTLGFSRRAGEIVGGFEKVVDKLERGVVAALLEAVDGAPDGHRKMMGKLKAAQGYGLIGDVRVLRPLYAREMGLALGRAHVIHAALIKGRMVEKALADLARLEVYGRTRPTTGGPDEEDRGC